MHHAFSDGIGLIQMFSDWSNFDHIPPKPYTWAELKKDVIEFPDRFIKGGKYSFKA